MAMGCRAATPINVAMLAKDAGYTLCDLLDSSDNLYTIISLFTIIIFFLIVRKKAARLMKAVSFVRFFAHVH